MSSTQIDIATRPPRMRFMDLIGTRPAAFFACLLAWTLTNADQALFGYAVPGLLEEFKLPLETIGVILTVSFLVSAVVVVFAGMAADRYGRGGALALLLAVSAMLVGAQGFATGIVELTVVRALGFGFSGGLAAITNAIVIENATPRYRGVALGLLQCGYPLGWLVASFGAAPLLAEHGWRATCFVAFAVVPFAVPLYFMLRRPAVSLRPRAMAPPADTGARSGWRTMLEPQYRRATFASTAIFFMFGGAYAGSAFFFPTFFTQQRSYTASQAAALVGVSNGIAVFGYMSAALVGEFVLTRRNVFVLWCLGGALALCGLLWLSGSRGSDLVWYGVMAALFFGSQAVFVVMVLELFPAEIRATALAICGSAPCYLGFAIFPVVVPKLVGAFGWQAGLSVVIVPLLLGAGLTALVLPNRPSGEPMV